MSGRIDVVGIGPGNPEWMTPVARRILSEADVVIGGRRQLQELSGSVKQTKLLEGNYEEIVGWIAAHGDTLRIAVAVSGDTGFHSLLGYLKRHLPDTFINAVPGIGSLQYFFGRLALGWERARFLSAHGRRIDFTTFDEDTLAAVLTDGTMTPGAMAAELVLMEKGDLWMAVGENLSYCNESITIARAEEVQHMLFEPLNAVIVLPEDMAEEVRRRGRT